jgi:hypothetical protein
MRDKKNKKSKKMLYFRTKKEEEGCFYRKQEAQRRLPVSNPGLFHRTGPGFTTAPQVKIISSHAPLNILSL